MAPVQEQMVPLNCPPGNQMQVPGSYPGNVPIGLNKISFETTWCGVLDVTQYFYVTTVLPRSGVSHHDRPAHHQAEAGDAGGRGWGDGLWPGDCQQVQDKECAGPGISIFILMLVTNT